MYVHVKGLESEEGLRPLPPPTLLLKRLVSRHRVTHSHNLRLAAGLARRNRFSTAALVVVGGAGSGVCGRTNQSGVLLQWQYFTCMY